MIGLRNITALTLLLAAQPALASGGRLSSGTAPEIPWLRLVFALLFCLLIALAAILALRHYQRSGGRFQIASLLRETRADAGPAIRLLETRRISIHADLCVVEFDGQRLLLAASASGVTVLERAALSLPVAEPGA